MDQKKTLEQYNDKFKVGEIVAIVRDSGEVFVSRILSPFQLPEKGRPGVRIEGEQGYCDAEKVMKITSFPRIMIIDRNVSARLMLAPILKALEIKIGDKGQKYDIPPGDLITLCLKSISRLNNIIKRQKQTILTLRDKREDDAQTVAKFISLYTKGEEMR